MAAKFKVTFLATRETRSCVQGSYLYYYVQDGEITLNVKTCLVWCDVCHAVTMGEDLKSLESAEAEIAEYQDPKSETCRSLTQKSEGGDVSAETLILRRKEAILRKEFLLQRIAPPKCLECGTTNIYVLRDGEAVETPVGPITIQCVALASVGFHGYCSPEGDRVEYFQPKKPGMLSDWRRWWPWSK